MPPTKKPIRRRTKAYAEGYAAGRAQAHHDLIDGALVVGKLLLRAMSLAPKSPVEPEPKTETVPRSSPYSYGGFNARCPYSPCALFAGHAGPHSSQPEPKKA